MGLPTTPNLGLTPAREAEGRGPEELIYSFFPEPKDQNNVTRPGGRLPASWGSVPGLEVAPGLSGKQPLPFRGGWPPYLGVKHDLWGPVPACGHVFRQKASVVVLRIGDPGKTKITDLECNPGY